MYAKYFISSTNLILDALAVSTGYKIKTFCPLENHFYSMFFVSERTLRLNSTYTILGYLPELLLTYERVLSAT